MRLRSSGGQCERAREKLRASEGEIAKLRVAGENCGRNCGLRRDVPPAAGASSSRPGLPLALTAAAGGGAAGGGTFDAGGAAGVGAAGPPDAGPPPSSHLRRAASLASRLPSVDGAPAGAAAAGAAGLAGLAAAAAGDFTAGAAAAAAPGGFAEGAGEEVLPGDAAGGALAALSGLLSAPPSHWRRAASFLAKSSSLDAGGAALLGGSCPKDRVSGGIGKTTPFRVDERALK